MAVPTKIAESIHHDEPAAAPPEQSASLQDTLAQAAATAASKSRELAVLPLLRSGFAELSRLAKPREFPEFFARYAQQTGVRMLLLKRWTSGLQVFMETNIRMPAEVRSKRPDGRAPIPSERGDVFQATGEDAEVYAGHVPIESFPLDLTLMLGRGGRDRKIVILPLPSQNHWNTFIYLDGGSTGGRALETAEILARYALSRMINLSYRPSRSRGRVEAIRKSETLRRHQAPAPTPTPPRPQAVAKQPAPPVDPVVLPEFLDADPNETAPPAPVVRETPQADPFVAAEPIESDPAPEVDAAAMTPESLIRQSGELPALPKAACHIMAVIEDPRTTATSLEKALAMDQTLTAKVLRIANSPFYGAVREISTVSEAIVRLGFVAIRNWTLVTAARSVFLAPGAGMLYQRIWKQSVLSAMAAQLVAQTVGGREPESVFIGGLMQNIGQLVLARSHPELFHEILADSAESGRPYHEVEREVLGFDHGELGAHLIREWNLSPELEDAVRWHHRFAEEPARNTRMAAMIALGEEIGLCSGSPSDPAAPAEDEDPVSAAVHAGEAAGYLGVSEAGIERLMKDAADLHIDPHFFS
ncbi:MAG: HDOD domain-containing protein [bacterium]|nr:HDOD domain-containing protein [bacterium]